MIKLVISDNEGTTTVVPLVRDEITIGRKEGNTIRLTERNISREHCRLARHNGSYVVRDLRSYNGVSINGQRVDGESPVSPGDEIRVGDYTLQLKLEEQERKDDPEADPTTVAPTAKSASPARLVVLTAPLAGAEFSLPEHGELRLGRAPELDVTLDHRSVSREHAKIACDGAQIRIIDCGSVNGVVVNHEKVSEARLAAGDVVELGDVLLRFVGAGEPYMFDPAEARALGASKRDRFRSPQLLALAIVVGALIVALAIVYSGQKPAPPEHSQLAAKPAMAAPPAALPVAPAGSLQAVSGQAAGGDHFAELLDSCRQANEGGRYAEAVAHANAALKARPDAPEALACQEAARANDEQEQTYVRAKAALQAGDLEGAWKELASLSADGAVRKRPEVEAVLESVARQRLGQGQAGLRKRPEQAAELASSVLAVEPLPDDIRRQAQGLASRAAAAHPGKAGRADLALHPAVADPHAKPVQASRPAAAAPHAAAGEKSAMDAASACLARGDNACVIRTLNGKTQSSQELGLLVETYRAVGDTAQANRNMALYVQRYPTARRAEAYRQMLERQGR
jgi:pSer/pThr/pTyr-binding forkhead associated (FHA) protein